MRLHKPVLLNEAVALLNCRSEGLYVDCTLGMGGHSEAILKASAPGGRLLAFDKDQQAIDYATQRLSAYKDRMVVVREDYRKLPTVLAEYELPSPDGILADFGPSLLQFSSANRGFSFQIEGPLDMRMDQSQISTASELVNESAEHELRQILREFGEEQAASRIARKIVQQRKESQITTTTQLRDLVESVLPRRRDQKIHPATKTFQALRIAVNRELENLDNFVFDAFDSLAAGGRLVMISFHSLEDRIVKQAFQFLSAACRCPKRYVECQCGGKPLSRLLTRKPVIPDAKEIENNPASRSARLRAVEKLQGPAQREYWKEWLSER